MNKRSSGGKIILKMALMLVLLQFCFILPGIRSDAENNYNDCPDDKGVRVERTQVSIITPNNTTIQAFKYFGTETPPLKSYANYPSAQPIAGTESFCYNCHGFALYSLGHYNDPSNAFFLKQPGCNAYFNITSCYSKIISNDYFAQINASVAPAMLKNYYTAVKPGDIVIYYSLNAGNGLQYKHSAIVTKSTSQAIYVISKWDDERVFRHKVEECPNISYQEKAGQYDVIVYVYRPLHNTNNYNSTPPTKTGTIYRFKRYYSINDQKHRELCDCGRTYNDYNHSYVPFGSNGYKCTVCKHTVFGYTPNTSEHIDVIERRP